MSRAAGRLPGIRFESPALLESDEALPRMDVALLVGFAASGPINVPVPIGQAAEFADIFGPDLPLARDLKRGGLLYACLAPAVRDFFRNGGRRCWIVRVAGGTAQSNVFPLPGLVRVGENGFTPATAIARSEGSWSDEVRVATAIDARAVPETAVRRTDAGQFTADGSRDPRLVDGDLLRLVFRDAACTAFGVLRPAAPGSGGFVLESLVWFRMAGSGALERVDPANQPQLAQLASPDVVEQLSLELLARRGSAQPLRVRGLGFASGHPRFWKNLPTDRVLYQQQVDSTPALPWPDLADITSPRFPLAGREQAPANGPAEVYLPIGGSVWPDYRAPLPQSDSAEKRNGLQAFDPSVFLDQRLGTTNVNALLAQAEFVRYQSADTPQPLAGIHAGFFIDEVSLIAVPDAVHSGWHEEAETHVAPASPPQIAEPPKPAQPDEGAFRECAPRVLAAPVLTLEQPPDPQTIRVRWSGAGDTFTLEEAIGPEFTPWVAIGSGLLVPGRSTTFDVYGRPPGEYAYRVTVQGGGLVSPVSNTVFALLEARYRTVVDDAPAGYDDLLDVQRALVRLCAARGDAFAVLALPRDYREQTAVDYVRRLRAPGPSDPRRLVAPIGAGEEYAFSYGAVYHPWLIAAGVDGGRLLRTPPDGAASGLMAARALARGAWIAPANEPLAGVVALEPPLDAARLGDLQSGGLNIIRQEPRGFLVLSAQTLSLDPDLRPINVRRLLSLIRRRALRVGSRYVFEPNGDEFRRMVERGFEQMLGELQARGAFAGATRATSYQVVADSSRNTPASRDQGRFFVDLRVAPSAPLAFLTVRLVQEGDRLTASEGR